VKEREKGTNQTPKKGEKKVQKKCARVREQAERVESGECLTRVMAEQGEGGEGGEDFGHEIDHCGNFFFHFFFYFVDFPICLAKDSPKGTRKMERPISIMITITPIEAHIKSSLTPQPENTERAAGNGRICGQTPFFFISSPKSDSLDLKSDLHLAQFVGVNDLAGFRGRAVAAHPWASM